MAPCNDNNIVTSMELIQCKKLIIPADRLKLLVARIVVRIAP